jgi:hypothetical protein
MLLFNFNFFTSKLKSPEANYQVSTSKEEEDNVAYMLKTRTVDPEKQPLLANGSETTFVSMQRPRNKQWNNVRS